MIDGMDGVEACWHFAGILGFEPQRKTLRTLWRLATGRSTQRRIEMVEQAMLVLSLGDMDIERYILFGEIFTDVGGGELKLSPKLEAKVQEEVERIKKEKANKKLPKPRMPVA